LVICAIFWPPPSTKLTNAQNLSFFSPPKRRKIAPNQNNNTNLLNYLCPSSAGSSSSSSGSSSSVLTVLLLTVPNWPACEPIPIQFLDWRSPDALVAIAVAIMGLCLTLATGLVFIRHNGTPVVKSSTRELSYMILFAMVLCYVNTFVMVAKPSRRTCAIGRILPGFSFSMLYGALVTKTNRIARILAGSKKKIITRRPIFMSPAAQVAITWLIICVECAVIVTMLIREPADKMFDFPNDERVLLVCNTSALGLMGECCWK